MIKIETKDNGTFIYFEKLPETITAGIKNGLVKSLLLLQRLVVLALTHGTYGVKTRTGLLRASFSIGNANNVYKLNTSRNNFTGFLGTNVKYAAIQEYGGTIYPKTAKFLTIPISPMSQGRSARDFNLTFRGKAGKGLLAGIMQGKEFVPLFVLVKPAKIPAHYYLRNTMYTAFPQVQQILSQSLVTP